MARLIAGVDGSGTSSPTRGMLSRGDLHAGRHGHRQIVGTACSNL